MEVGCFIVPTSYIWTSNLVTMYCETWSVFLKNSWGPATSPEFVVVKSKILSSILNRKIRISENEDWKINFLGESLKLLP